MKSLIAFCLISAAAYNVHAETYFYVRSGGTGGNGSITNPWNNTPSWPAVQSALSSDTVTIYFDAHGVWSANEFTVGASTYEDSGTNWLTLDGMSKYWDGASFQDESGGSKATYTNQYANASGNIQTGTSVETSYIVIRGFIFNGRPLATRYANPAVNVYRCSDFHHITVENCEVNNSNQGGIYWTYLEDGVHDLTIRNNIVNGTQTEGIYVGHFSYLTDDITNVVVENNTLINTGASTEGDIDIKPPCYGAIIRNNTSYHTIETGDGGACGVVVSADNCRVYGNRFYSIGDKVSNTWGHGIYVNSDGDAQTGGKPVTACLIYNNLIYLNRGVGIRLSANWGSELSGLRIYNNTIVGNEDGGIVASESGGSTMAIADMRNNIVSSNNGYSFSESGAVTISSCDNNLWYSPAGNLVFYNDAVRTFNYWRSTAGFDANGLNADPVLSQYIPTAGSPAVVRTGGYNLSAYFTADFNGSARNTEWSIGAIQYNPASSDTTAPAPPQLFIR